MAIQALKGWSVSTKELIEVTGTDENGSTLEDGARALRAYGLDARVFNKHLSFDAARRILLSGRLIIVSTRIHGIPHVTVLSGVKSDGTIRVADPSPRGGQYKRFGASYITVRRFPRGRFVCRKSRFKKGAPRGQESGVL